jgi:hypothetical protein
MPSKKVTEGGRLYDQVRSDPVYNHAGWLRHLADKIETGCMSVQAHQLVQDTEDLTYSIKLKPLSATQLETLVTAEKDD